MDQNAYITENNKTREKLEQLIKNIKETLNDLYIPLVAFYCDIYSDICGNVEQFNKQESKKLGKEAVDLLTRFDELLTKYEELNKTYVEEATALTVADNPVPLLDFESEILPTLLNYLYKIIMIYKNVLTLDNLDNKDENLEDIKGAKDGGQYLYNRFKSLLSEPQKECVADFEKKLDTYLLPNLSPSESDFALLREKTSIIDEYFIDSPVSHNPAAFSDLSEDAFEGWEGDKKISDSPEAFGDWEDSKEPEDFGDWEDSKEPEDFGDWEDSKEPKDSHTKKEEEKVITIRPINKGEDIRDYESYLREQYKKCNYSPRLYDNYSYSTIPLDTYIREKYPHETELPIKEVKYGDYTIVSSIEGEPIYNGYKQYLDYCLKELRQEREAEELIQYFEDNTPPTEYIYTKPINDLIKLLKQTETHEKDKESNELYKVTINLSDLQVVLIDYVIYLSKDEVKKLIKIVGSLNKNNIVFCGKIRIGVVKRYINNKEEDYTLDQFLKETSSHPSKNEEEVAKVVEEPSATPYEGAQKNEEPSATQYEAVPMTEDPIAMPDIDKKTGFASSSSVDFNSPYFSPAGQEETTGDEIAKLRSEVQRLQKELERQKQRNASAKENLPKSGPRIQIPKGKQPLLLYKMEVYNAIISQLFERQLVISKENFETILKELYENQSFDKPYKIKYNSDNSEYYIDDEYNGERLSVTISYSGFLRKAESTVEKKEDGLYSLNSGGYRFNLNLKKISPERVDTTKAVLFTCISTSKISVKGTKIIISSFVKNHLAKVQAKAKITYNSTNGVSPGYDLDFEKINKEDNLELPLTRADKSKPITISVFLDNGEQITIVLERAEKTSTKKL